MSKSLIIVESPTKAKTIKKFLSKGYLVQASYGHVRDLPNSASEIPAEEKKNPWAKLGVNVEKNFEPFYIVPSDKKKRVKELKDSLKEVDELLLATDEDREGESISWHLLQVLKPKVPVKRLVFHEITKGAIQKALVNTRDINENLVRAQETRRVVDRLFGYTVSPLLWKKMAPRLSAGRVQSVALRILVERERERINFTSGEYWDLRASLSPRDEEGAFDADLISVEGVRLASGRDFDPVTGKIASGLNVELIDREKAHQLCERLLNGKQLPKVDSVEEKPFVQKPYAPFTTSTLQQEASRKLGFGAKRTMQVAQTLYENGYITYMRTDSTHLSDEAINAARNLIRDQYGPSYLPDVPRVYKTSVKNAQEAHEAIRPSGEQFTPLDVVKSALGPEAGKLYELIWKRALASQMKDAEGTRMTVKIECDRTIFRASGKSIKFAGFLRAYVEGSDDPEAELADKEKILPPLKVGQELKFLKLEALEHHTQPPARFTEGALIKELERLGIGRPSTWATIVDVVLSRTYAFKKGTSLVPTFLAMAVIGLMEGHLCKVVDYDFTARLEDDLDEIAGGGRDHLAYLKGFFLGDNPGLDRIVKQCETDIDPRIVCGIPVFKDDEKTIEVRIGRYGPFLSDGERRAGLPIDLCPDELTRPMAESLLEESSKSPESLGLHPESGLPIYVKTGRYGPYVQEGDIEDVSKPKMASLLNGMTIEDVNLDVAVKLLSLPRSLGIHPTLNEEILAANGRFGPFVKCGNESRSIPADNSPIKITLDEAIELLSQPKGQRGRGSAPKILKELGKHPVTELTVVIKSGRYGPYATDGKLNASLPKGISIEDITLDMAAELLTARANQ
jgi:DNA topoisomerase-1